MSARNHNGLTDLQQRFVAAYLKTTPPNGTQAYIDAGGKARGNAAAACGSRMLTCAKVRAAIEAGQQRVMAAAEIDAGRIVAELERVALSDMRQFASWGPGGVSLKDSGELPEDAARCVAEVSQTTTKGGGSIHFKLHSKVEALRLLGQYLKMFTEKYEHSGPDGGPIPLKVTEIVVRTREEAGSILSRLPEAT